MYFLRYEFYIQITMNWNPWCFEIPDWCLIFSSTQQRIPIFHLPFGYKQILPPYSHKRNRSVDFLINATNLYIQWFFFEILLAKTYDPNTEILIQFVFDLERTFRRNIYNFFHNDLRSSLVMYASKPTFWKNSFSFDFCFHHSASVSPANKNT